MLQFLIKHSGQALHLVRPGSNSNLTLQQCVDLILFLRELLFTFFQRILQLQFLKTYPRQNNRIYSLKYAMLIKPQYKQSYDMEQLTYAHSRQLLRTETEG